MTDALILCVETSTPRASLAILRGSGEVLFEASFTSDRSHNAGLFEPLQRALAVLADGEKLSAVVIGTGPGSYSGTRVGIAAGQGVAIVHGCPAAGLSSLAATGAVGPALAVGDARRGSVWAVEVRPGQVVAEPVLETADELEMRLGEAFVRGWPAFALESVAKTGLPEDLLEKVTLAVPDAVALGLAWLALPPERRTELENEPVQPVYLRPPHITEAKGGHPLAGRRVARS